MAKRDRRGGFSPKSKARRSTEASGEGSSHQQAMALTSAPLPSAPLPNAVVQSGPAPTQRLGSGRRVRTPLPGVVRSDGEGAPKLPAETAPKGTPSPDLGLGRRIRTELPQAVPGELEEINLEALGTGPRAKMLREKAEQFGSIQDFLRNPVPFDLSSKELDTSSSPEEIDSRKGEVRYQIQVMRSMLAVLTDELNQLEDARPPAAPDQTPPNHS